MLTNIKFIHLYIIIITSFNIGNVFPNTDTINRFDKRFIVGELNNGLRYYICKNNIPENKISLYLVVKAGSLNENENQNGVAHFCEHMAFRGTKNYPGNNLKKYLKSNGLNFIKNYNARTYYDRTVFNINGISSKKTDLLDSCFLIIKDWACGIQFRETAINEERNVIKEELYLINNKPISRLREKTDSIKYNGSKHYSHNPIGDIKFIENCDSNDIIEYYKEWYNPKNQAIIVIGDIDVQNMEDKIKYTFGKLKNSNFATYKINEQIKLYKGLNISIATDKELSKPTIRYYFHKYKDKKDTNNIDPFIIELYNELYFRCFSSRYYELKIKEKLPFYDTKGYHINLSSNTESFFIKNMPYKENLLNSIKSVLIEFERIKRYGFLPSELERAKLKTYLKYEQKYKNRNKIHSNKLSVICIENFINNKPYLSIEYKYTNLDKYLSKITVNELNKYQNLYYNENYQTLIVHCPDQENLNIPTENELKNLITNLKDIHTDPYVDNFTNKKLITKNIVPGKIIESKTLNEVSSQYWKLSNGAGVIFKQDVNSDKVTFQCFSPGGYLAMPEGDKKYIDFIDEFYSYGGIGNFNISERKNYLIGKYVSLKPWINLNETGISGECNLNDLEVLLQLMHLVFTSPGKDSITFNNCIQNYKSEFETKSKIPINILYDTIELVKSNYHISEKPKRISEFDKISFQKTRDIFIREYSNPADFTYLIVGNIDTIKIKKLIEKYIGSIHNKSLEQKITNSNIVPSNGQTKIKFKCKMINPLGYSYLQFWKTNTNANLDKNSVCIFLLSNILEDKINALLRDKFHKIYNKVPINSNITKNSSEHLLSINLKITCNYENIEPITSQVYNYIINFSNDDISNEDLKNAKDDYIKQLKKKTNQTEYKIDNIKTFYKTGNLHPLNNSISVLNKIDKQSIIAFLNDIIDTNYIEVIMLPK